MIRFIIHIAIASVLIYSIAHLASKSTGASYKFCIASPVGEVMQKCWTTAFTADGYMGLSDSQNKATETQPNQGEK